jgi:hypothetical protein
MTTKTRLWTIWILLAIGILFIGGFWLIYRDAMPNTLRRTSNGFWGTGTHTWRYRTGEPMRIDEVYRGRETKSRWLDRQGNLVGETTWSNGDGIAYFMRQDGTLKSKMTCQSCIAHGTTWYFNQDGTLAGQAEFINGQFVSGYRPTAGQESVEFREMTHRDSAPRMACSTARR